MGFTLLTIVENFLPDNINTVLAADGAFAAVEAAAAEIIAAVTGLAIPEDAADSPGYVHFPAALLIKKIASADISIKSEEFQKQIAADYSLAIELLRNASAKSNTAVFGLAAPINGGYYDLVEERDEL